MNSITQRELRYRHNNYDNYALLLFVITPTQFDWYYRSGAEFDVEIIITGCPVIMVGTIKNSLGFNLARDLSQPNHLSSLPSSRSSGCS